VNPRLYKWGFSPLAAVLVFIFAQTAARTMAFAAFLFVHGSIGFGFLFFAIAALMFAAPVFAVELIVGLSRPPDATPAEHAQRATVFRRGTAVGLIGGAITLFFAANFSWAARGGGIAASLVVTAASFYAVRVLDARRRISNEL
jgi:hypothetical protein